MGTIRHVLHSTAISEVSYETETHQMDITFTTGRTYTYEDVPEEVFEGLAGADSAGRYYAQNIKGVYV